MKLAMRSKLTEDSLRFAQQLGVTHLSVDATSFMDSSGKGVINASKVRSAIKKAAAYDLKIAVVLLPQNIDSQYWNAKLGKSEREGELRDVSETIRILGNEGIPVVEYVFNLAGVYGSTMKPEGRGGAFVRSFDYDAIKDTAIKEEYFASEQEVWDRITYFLENVVPSAEEAGVKLACHPDDPPVPALRGETRVLGTIDGLKRLIQLVPSEANGIMFCQGTIAEMGADVLEAIHYFGTRKKIHHVHFRDVQGALPRFTEAFIDDGTLDMVAAIKAYKDVGYTGTIMPDHVPALVGDNFETVNIIESKGRAHAIGYIKGLLDSLEFYERNNSF